MENNCYDVIVIGGGPGGYCAALYAARANLNTLVIEKFAPGGQMATTEIVENYPGFVDGINGFELGMQMKKGAERFGAKTEYAEVLSVDFSDTIKKLITTNGEYLAKTVVIATGANPRKLGLSKEEELVGRGVAYCASCDGAFYRGKTVAVVGGGNSAAADALLLSRIAKKVIVIHRRDSLRATKVYHQPLMAAENVEFYWNSTVEEILAEQKVKGLRLRNVHSGQEEEIAVDGVFISVGRKPATELVKEQLSLEMKDFSFNCLIFQNHYVRMPKAFAHNII